MITLNNDTQLGTLIENQFGDKYLFSVNRKIFEQLGYQANFHKEYADKFEKENTLYLITGTDSGLMVKQLLKTPPKKGSTYLFIELPEITALTKTQYDLEDQKRIVVTTADKWKEEAAKIGMDTYFWLNNVELVKSFAAQYYHLYEYLFLKKNIEDDINHLTWQYQSQLGSMVFVQRQLENLAENQTPAITIKDHFKGKSALILAGGPSLDEHISWIEKNQEHYLVIAVTRIARRLLQTKIKPDIFVSVDPHPVNFEVSREVLQFEQESLLINQYHLSPRILGNWQGINLFLGNIFPWKTKLNINNFTGTGPTVTNTAILLAIQLEIKQQILFGVDLCYSPEGYTHASGSSEHNDGPNVSTMGQTVKTNKGEKAETNPAYFEAISSIENLAKLAKESGGSLINPSPNSAKMIDVRYSLISDIHIPEEHISISKFLTEQFNQNTQAEYKITHYKNVLRELKEAQQKIKQIKKLASKGLEYNKKFFTGDDPSKNYNFKLKMDKLEKELSHKDLIDFSTLSKKFGMREFLYFLKPDKDMEWTNNDIEESGNAYYKALKFGAEKFSKHIFSAINRTETRMLEEGQLDVDEQIINRHLCSFEESSLLDSTNNKEEIIAGVKNIITNYYSNNIKPGKTKEEKIQIISFFLVMFQNGVNLQTRRLIILKRRNPALFNIADSIELLDLDDSIPMLDIFGKTVKAIKQAHRKIYHSWLSHEPPDQPKINITRFEGLEAKLYNLFILKDITAIKKVIESLQLIDQKIPEKEEFFHLAQGYNYELENKTDKAIEEYGLSDGPKTTESALKRLAMITLDRQEFNSTHDVLQILSDISPEYLPQLAELYLITKNYKDALDTFTTYLDYNNSDITILLKVGLLYESQDILDGAQFIYNHILELEPENQIAKSHLKKLESVPKIK
ncbi:MAG: DUF115 domain-containing protein [Gammaproteobacteria bacterium]|nr:DUF115 domain-containing protein [Gammaproteobacteria bacterium]